jgi:hypothetical protein
MDTSHDSPGQSSNRESRQITKLRTFNYLHNSTYKKEIFSKRLNARYVKFYKWIDKKNWGFTDMELDNPADTPSQNSHLTYQPPYSFTSSSDIIWNSSELTNGYRSSVESKTGLFIVTNQLDHISKRNAKQQIRWNRFLQQCEYHQTSITYNYGYNKD